MERVLPEDIMLNIFSRVPFESVSECRLVSKKWKYLISNLTKVNSSHSSDSKVSFISLNMLQVDKVQLLSLEYDNEKQQQQSQLRISKMNHPLISRVHYDCMRLGDEAPLWKTQSVIIGSSNGLICLYVPGYGDPLYICNPVTREFVSLPISSAKCLKNRNVFGFGYNDRTNEYKVVRIYYGSEYAETGQVQVYTLGAGTGWRNKGVIAYSLQTNNYYSPGMNVDGEVYWLHQGMSSTMFPSKLLKLNDGRIVAFNLADEVLRVLPNLPYYTTLPCRRKYVGVRDHQIQVLGGRLCYIDVETYDDINIWSFKKKNDSSNSSINEKEEDSSNWSLAGSVKLQRNNLVQFFDLTKSGEILYWDGRKTALSYDLRTTSIKELLNDGTTGLDVFETIRHENSFVSLKALGEENVKMFDRIN